MDRRTFLRSTAASLPIALGASVRGQQDERPVDVGPLESIRITEVIGFRHVCPRPKFVGKNSHLDDHGDHTAEDCLRLRTDSGLEGIGVGRLSREAAQQVVGKRLSELFTPGVGSTGPLGRADHALFDLVGKALELPAWRLIGSAGPEWVPIYDGSIYFADLLPQYEGRGIARVLEEIDEGLERGQRAFKIKVGRGYKWMEPEAGTRRDVEVVRAIHDHVGPGVRLMVDANNGFTRATAERFLDAVGVDLFFAEEMFPEEVAEDLAFQEYLAGKGWRTLVADGESAGDVAHFEPYIDAGALDVLQGDIRAFGLSRLWALSRRAESRPGITLAPHNWGSFLGVYMQAVLARGIPNFLMAEMDTSTSDLFDTSAFTVRDGRLRVPDQPGNGLALRADVWAARYAPDAWTVRVGS